MEYDKYAVLPRVLLEELPQLRAPLLGEAGVRGEAMAYPFAGGGLLLCAVRSPSLEDGLYPLHLEGTDMPELPGLLLAAGMGCGMTLLPLDMEQLYGRRLVFGRELAAGAFAFN